MTTAAYEPIVTQAGLNAAARAQAESRVLQITHVAVGTGAYAPTGMEIALSDERASAPVHRRKHIEGSIWQIAATITGDADYFASEVGFFADDEGTPVLMFVYSSTARVFAAVTDGQETLLELNVSLASVPAGTVEFSFLDADQTMQEMLDDMSGEHLPGNNFNFALTRNLKEHMYTSMEQFELMAQIRRGYGQSGVRMGRHYSNGGDAAYHRPSVVSFAALGVHDHPNYPLMCGMPEITAVVNGYEVNTRHIDYKIVHSIGDAYLAVDDAIPPAVPPSVAAQATPEDQIAEMREYIRAFGAKDPSIRDYRPHFDTYMSVMEVWLEDLSGDALVDTFPSFRHQLSNLGHKHMNADYMALMASGLKPRFENDDFKPTVIRVMREDGSPQFAVLRYRVSAVRLGTYAEYPVHEMVSQVDDPATRVRKGVTDDDMLANRLGRFRVNHAIGDDSIMARSEPGLLDEIMGKVPGIDGMGGDITEEYTDTNDNGVEFVQRLMQYRTTNLMNSAYYSRFYSFELPGAAGRRDYRFGYNDPYLFHAATTRDEVTALPGMGGGHRLSWAIPLELIVATPLGSWNPYEVPVGNASPSGNGNTVATAYSHAHINGKWMLTPDAMFSDGDDAPDPADTSAAAFMMCGDGQARLMRGSGVYVHLPKVSGQIGGRIRYPIAPVHHEGSFEFGHFEAVRHEQQGVLAAMTDAITEMKHTARYGGNNGS